VGLTGALLRSGAARPHVLIAAVPGGTAVRLAAEAEARRRGWPCALTPADTDLLLVAGIAPGEFGQVLEEVWRAVPAPRVRAQASGPGEVPALLDAARAGLGDLAGQRAADPAARQPLAAAAGPAMGAGHGHGGDGMEMPGGLAVAGRGEDRDGLKLDQLHVPVGPVLTDWPAGLVVHVTLQGDVVQHASVRAVGVGGEGRSFWAEPWRRSAVGDLVPAGAAARRLLASHLDSLGRLLAVAGWGDAAVTARRLRDEALADAPAAVLEPAARRFAGRVARSRVLGWLTRGLGILGAGEAAAAGVRGPALRAGGDVTTRYRRWCRELVEAAALLGEASPVDPGVLEPPRGRLEGAGAPSAGLMAVLPGLLAGAEFAAARLIVASLDPDLDELTAAAVWAGAGHGG
jgi:hypothetical protein